MGLDVSPRPTFDREGRKERKKGGPRRYGDVRMMMMMTITRRKKEAYSRRKNRMIERKLYIMETS